MANLVKFLKGTRASYDALATKDTNTFYNTDDDKLFLGAIPLGGGTISVAAAATPAAGYAKTYEIKQNDTLIGTIDIPKDMVISAGEVKVADASDTAIDSTVVAGEKYIVLTIANATNDKLYISVKDLVDTYTAEANATQIQLAIDSSTNEISATIVAGSVTVTELANDAVETVKIKDKNVTKAKLEQELQDAIDAMYWGTIPTTP